ncbi:MAG TPA: 30S ribosomal protein S9 [bacterium]|nr:30S ribosomal protein S9 [bacterium]HQO36777.1 30S ribosomal protein S9 [bacterium]HQP98973.1 30S ribosomal protein S9 [bacterium]
MSDVRGTYIAYATGRRKSSVARVYLKPGSGEITCNGRPLKDYFTRPIHEVVISQPLELTQQKGKLDVVVRLHGGGLSGQAGATRLGISRALSELDPKLRKPLKKAGYLTRDARMVERKKYGRPGARKRFQFSKR